MRATLPKGAAPAAEATTPADHPAPPPAVFSGRGIRQRLAAREDSEHEQALVRCGFSLFIMAYLLSAPWWQPAYAEHLAFCLPVSALYIAGSFLVMAHIIARPRINIVRRHIGMALDLVTLPIGMIAGNELMAPFYPFYLWVTFGMGFRFGRQYLLRAAIASLVGFGVVVVSTPFWRQYPALAGGLLLALLLLPAYAYTLLAKLTDALDRAAMASRAKSRFLATMSHELRTPLNAIIGMTDAMQGAPLSADQRDMMHTIRDAGDQLLRQIQDVLDFSKIEAGIDTCVQERFDLPAALHTIQRLLAQQAQDKNITLNLRFVGPIPAWIEGPEQDLRQVLINLIGNAIKFTDRGGVVLCARISDRENDQALLEIAVADTGIGISPAAQARVFEHFAQADETTTRRYGGSGLGLAIAKHMVERWGGTIKLHSVEQAGSAFTVTVPVTVLADEPRRLPRQVVLCDSAHNELTLPSAVSVLRAPTAPEQARIVQDAGDETVFIGSAASLSHDRLVMLDALSPGGLNVLLVGDAGAQPHARRHALVEFMPRGEALLVLLHALTPLNWRTATDNVVPFRRPSGGSAILVAEDNVVNEQVMRRLLEHLGHRVEVVSDGEAALDALAERSFDLVLMDLNMPRMGGLEAAKLYQFATPARGLVPIVALTADATTETRVACAEAGMAGCLTKPVTRAVLDEAIERYALRRYPSAQEPQAELAAAAEETSELQEPVLRAEKLAELEALDDDPTFVAELLASFAQDTAELIDGLRLATARGDAALFRDRAHAMRSSAAYIGAARLFALLLSWRNTTEAQMREEGEARVAAVEAEYRALLAAIEARYPALSDSLQRATT